MCIYRKFQNLEKIYSISRNDPILEKFRQGAVSNQKLKKKNF